MTNRELIEFLAVTTGKRVIFDKKYEDKILANENSIKEIYLTLKSSKVNGLELIDRYIGYLINKIIEKYDSESVGIAFKIISRDLMFYKMHINSYDISDFIDILDVKLGRKGLKELDRYLRIYSMKDSTIVMKNSQYTVEIEHNQDGSKYVNLRHGHNYMTHIGAVLFKGNIYEMLEVNNRKDSIEINKRLIEFDYDVCYCIDKNSIINKMKDRR